MSNVEDEIKRDIELDLDEFLEDFFEEAKEHIEHIEIGILNLERDMNNKDIINDIFRSFHTIKGLSGFVSQYNIEKISHITENVLVNIRKSKINVNRVIVDKFLDSIDFIKRLCFCPELNEDNIFLEELEKHIKILGSEDILNKKLGEILKETNILDEQDLEDLLEKQKDEDGVRLGELAVKENIISAKEAVKALREQEILINESNYIKIPINRIDEIINISGELMTLNSQMGTENSSSQNSKYVRMEKLIKDIQRSSMSLRMVSLKSTFQKLVRIQRDTSKNMNKKINFIKKGEETEIDRNISEKILEPLSHLLKNSIYHGIEDETERIKKGKKIDGEIEVNAYSKRGMVFIDLKDDGAGINIEKVYKKAKSKNLIDQNEIYSDKDIANLIFLPGFSTVENVDTIAGRGVGLDIVKERIIEFGGKVDIEFEKDVGTIFRMKIPINLASVNGTIVKIGGERYIVATSFIKEITQWNKEHVITIAQKEKMLKIRDKIVPILDSSKFFKSKAEKKEKSLFLILEQDLEQKAILVDEIVGRREIVVKALGEEFSEIKFVSGASILGDGKIALILDIENMFKNN